MALLSSGHFATDFSNGALPALLPFLKDKFSLSYTAVGAVILASQASSSLVQPLFGLWSDRRGAMWLLPTGVAVAGGGVAVAADAPSYWLPAPPLPGVGPRGGPPPPRGPEVGPLSPR